ncbi:MAG: hypothetical protein J4473_04045 [Candidatus Aenigmarchaeota archaeon]|nr:hypothetical protein [Candidatus Aenigmarchaeota archaeon]
MNRREFYLTVLGTIGAVLIGNKIGTERTERRYEQKVGELEDQVEVNNFLMELPAFYNGNPGDFVHEYVNTYNDGNVHNPGEVMGNALGLPFSGPDAARCMDNVQNFQIYDIRKIDENPNSVGSRFMVGVELRYKDIDGSKYELKSHRDMEQLYDVYNAPVELEKVDNQWKLIAVFR